MTEPRPQSTRQPPPHQRLGRAIRSVLTATARRSWTEPNYWLAGAIVLVATLLLGLMLGIFLPRQQEYPSEIVAIIAEPIDFTEFEIVEERKAAFFGYLLPLIRATNEQLREIRSQLAQIEEQGRANLKQTELNWLSGLAEKYEVEEFDPVDDTAWIKLKRRVDVVPASLSLAQAANESAWGTSRFAREGFNFFGHWCYVEGCGMIPERRIEGATHEVAAFDSPLEAVEKYIHNLNTHEAYQNLRQVREKMRSEKEAITGMALVGSLDKYSQRGSEYIEELQAIINFNDLAQYDYVAAETDLALPSLHSSPSGKQ